MTRQITKTCERCGKQFSGDWFRYKDQRYCSRDCIYPSPEKRFRARCPAGVPNECWEWQGTQRPDGYGVISIKRKAVMAHRLSWRIHNGSIPSDLYVLHKCDNRICVNPNHLFLGSKQDNIQDAINKGRAMIGELNPSAKLSEDDVKEIRERYSSGEINQTDLAEEYGIHQTTISLIVTNQKWTHV